MRATFFGIEIGRTGLSLSQLGLDVTGHNIANVDTKGYTRQRIVSTAYDPFSTIGRALPVEQALVGSGVRVKILDQIRSAYLDRRFRTENSTFSYWDKRAESLRYVESFFDNVNEETSLNFSIARFFEAMKVLAEDPVEGAPRKLLQTAGQDLVQQLNSVYDGLIELQEAQNKAVEITVDEINRIAAEIVELNKAIYGFEITGHIANDLRDKRNLLLDELSTLVDIEYKEYPDGYSVSVGERGNSFLEVSIGGRVLIDHDSRNLLGTRDDVPNPIDGEADIHVPVWLDRNGDPIVETDANGDEVFADLIISGGELKAYMDMRDNNTIDRPGIPYYIEMLNNLARALVQEINEVHRQGWTDPPVGISENYVDFFYYDEGDSLGIEQITAKNIRLSDKVLESEYNIACSTIQIVKQGSPEDLQRGNNVNMNNLYALFLKKDISLEDIGDGIAIGSFDGFVTSMRFDAGNSLNFAMKTADTSRTLTLAAENQRTSISGVSLDEEMTSLMKYQHAYSGAARVITAMDDALDRLINGTGRVGL